MRAEFDRLTLTCIGVGHAAYEIERLSVILGFYGCRCVSRHLNTKTAHVGVVRREKDTDVGRNAGYGQAENIFGKQEHAKRCGIKSGALGLYDKEVVRFWFEFFYDLTPLPRAF